MRRQGGELGRFIERQVEEFQPKLILNQVRSAQDMRIGSAMESACFKYFGIRLKFLGHIEHEDAVWHSVLQRRPLVMDQPNSGVSKRLSVICSAILQQRSQRPRTVEHTFAGEP
jgi:flagellar biosynthesis protein FlhG